MRGKAGKKYHHANGLRDDIFYARCKMKLCMRRGSVTGTYARSRDFNCAVLPKE